METLPKGLQIHLKEYAEKRANEVILDNYPMSDFRYDTYTNATSDFDMRITHIPSGNTVTNKSFRIKSQSKTREILKHRLISNLILLNI